MSTAAQNLLQNLGREVNYGLHWAQTENETMWRRLSEWAGGGQLTSPPPPDMVTGFSHAPYDTMNGITNIVELAKARRTARGLINAAKDAAFASPADRDNAVRLLERILAHVNAKLTSTNGKVRETLVDMAGRVLVGTNRDMIMTHLNGSTSDLKGLALSDAVSGTLPFAAFVATWQRVSRGSMPPTFLAQASPYVEKHRAELESLELGRHMGIARRKLTLT